PLPRARRSPRMPGTPPRSRTPPRRSGGVHPYRRPRAAPSAGRQARPCQSFPRCLSSRPAPFLRGQPASPTPPRARRPRSERRRTPTPPHEPPSRALVETLPHRERSAAYRRPSQNDAPPVASREGQTKSELKPVALRLSHPSSPRKLTAPALGTERRDGETTKRDTAATPARTDGLQSDGAVVAPDAAVPPDGGPALHERELIECGLVWVSPCWARSWLGRVGWWSFGVRVARDARRRSSGKAPARAARGGVASSVELVRRGSRRGPVTSAGSRRL